MSELNTLLDIINDPGKYKAKLDGLKAQSDRLDRKIQLIEQSGQIEPMFNKAKKDYASAKKLEEDTKAAMIQLENETSERLDQEFADMRLKQSDLERDQKAFELRMVEENKALELAQKAVKKRESDVSKREREADELNTTATALINEFNEKKSVLDGAIASVN